MSEGNRDIPRWLLPVGLAVLVTGLVAIALMRGPVELDPDSPEGTVQEYLLAIDEERWEDAIAVIHEDWLGSCEADDLSSFAQGDFSAQLGAPDGIGMGFSGVEPGVVEEFGEEPVDLAAEPPPGMDEQVEVTITHNDVGGLGGGWEEYVVFELADTDDFWWIVNDPWPYFTWNCR
jgi:hypothetical protein